ncbi:MAG: hypothetical protein JRD89_00415 [Deltaproteobacteria bacterium]|nr:hypothetical protein [Deltaproteobacteria bacterium]
MSVTFDVWPWADKLMLQLGLASQAKLVRLARWASQALKAKPKYEYRAYKADIKAEGPAFKLVWMEKPSGPCWLIWAKPKQAWAWPMWTEGCIIERQGRLWLQARGLGMIEIDSISQAIHILLARPGLGPAEAPAYKAEPDNGRPDRAIVTTLEGSQITYYYKPEPGYWARQTLQDKALARAWPKVVSSYRALMRLAREKQAQVKRAFD